MKVSLAIFSLNEIEGIKAVMPQIEKDWYDELIIVDGGSNDGTFEYAKEQGYFIFKQEKKGFGNAFHEIMKKVTGDIVIIFSPDGNSLPKKIPHLVQKIKQGYDVVIASRYKDGAKSDDDDIITAFGNFMFTAIINLLFRAKVTDALVMYRAYRTHVIRDLNIDTDTVAWGTQILIRAARKKFKIGEIPGSEPLRIGGKRKMSPLKNGICELAVIIKEFFSRRN